MQESTELAVGEDTEPYSVLAVADQLPVLQLLMLGIESDVRLRLAGIASDGHAAIRWVVSQECPDAIICEIKLPSLGGLEALAAMREACPDTVILVYTSAPDIAFTAQQLGADAVLDRSADPGELLDCLVVLCGNR